MSLLDPLRRSPTARWRRNDSVALIADLDRFALGPAKIGDEAGRLSFLGPSPSKGFRYYDRGLDLFVEGEKLAGFGLALAPDASLGAPAEDRVHPFGGVVRAGGADWTVGDLQGEPELVAALGEVYWRDEDEDEILLFFERPAGEIQVELSLDGRAQVLMATRERLLDSAEQRQRYGITRSWPTTW